MSQAQGTAVLSSIAPKVVPRPNVIPVAKVLFDSSQELPSGSGLDSTYSFGIHSFVQDLLNAGQYCPLTLFTNQNMEHLHREGHSLKRSKVHVNGVPHHLLDLSQFENELDIDPLSWQEAYQCYLTWIEDIGDASALKHWTSHFKILSKDDAVRKNFRAIIEFDIERRQNYALRPHQYDEGEWNHRLTKKKFDTMQEFIYCHKEQMSRSTGADRNAQASSSCFEPYDKDTKRHTKKSSDGDTNSFRDGKTSKSVDPMCTSADARVTDSLTALKRLRRKAYKISRSIQKALYANTTTDPSSASPIISTIPDVRASESMLSNTSAPSAGGQSTVRFPAPVSDHDPDYSYNITPYSADSFDFLLAKTNLTHQFPDLTYKLRNGFPIGHDLTPLTSSYTSNNLPGAEIFKDVCDEYVAEELTKGRYSGPFSHEELYAKIGHFRSSPLQVVVKKGTNGDPDKYCVCRHLSYAGLMGHSVNDEIDTEDYPTEWGTASEFADIVHRLSLLFSCTFLDQMLFALRPRLLLHQ
jgi:hypothetical protein